MRAIGIDIGGSSVKVAVLLSSDPDSASTAQSQPYSKPGKEQLVAAIRSSLTAIQITEPVSSVGLCVPGILDPAGQMVLHSVNVPGLTGLPLRELVEAALEKPVPKLSIINDAVATAADIVHTRRLTGRTIVLALGTGVGMGILDDRGQPLLIDGVSPGHIGQIDVSLDPDHAPIGPDGGAGSLEAYIGVPALIARYQSMERFFASVTSTDPAMRALTRAIRICHAIYRPQHIVLAGGVGVRLESLVNALKLQISANLTGIARLGWTLGVADHDFHAAIGAARLAMSTIV